MSKIQSIFKTKYWPIAAGLAVLVILAPVIALAAPTVTYNLVFGPAYQQDKYDPTTAQHFHGGGSWFYDKAAPPEKAEMYISPLASFGATFTVDQIQRITYHTFYVSADPSPSDLYLTIYTEPGSGASCKSPAIWYCNRLTGEPYFSINYVQLPSAWNTWTTDSGTNQLTLFDSNNSGNFGFYGAPTLQQIQAGPITWSTWPGNPGPGANPAPIDYGVETVKYFNFSTGSGWADVVSYLDYIEIELTTGELYQIDLEDAPAETWVDDSWSGSLVGMEVAPGAFFGYNAFATIQQGIDNVLAGGTVHVADGIYPEFNLLINKALTIQGAGGGSGGSVIDATGFSDISNVVRINLTSGNATLDGFRILTGQNMNGIYAHSSSAGSAITITNNYIEGWRTAVHPERTCSEDNFALITNGSYAALSFLHNEILMGCSNAILLERHYGSSDVSYNTWDRGVDDVDTAGYFNMNYAGADVTSLQKVSHNTIDLGGGTLFTNAQRTSGIDFAASYTGVPGGFTNVEISANTFTNLRPYRRAIQLWNNAPAPGLAGGISNAVIVDNTITGLGALETGSFGIRLLGKTVNTQVHNNFIADTAFGFRVGSWNEHVTEGVDVAFKENSLTATGTPVEWLGTGLLDASANWWGTNDPAALSAELGGLSVDYSPWLDGGTDTSADPGFQGDFSTLWVDDSSPQSASGGVIAEGQALVSGSTVYVAPGTYPETVTITEPLNLYGAQHGVPFAGRTPGSAAESIIDVRALSKGVLIMSSEVVVDGFEVWGDAATYVGVHAYATNSAGDIAHITVANNLIHGMGLPNPSSPAYVTSYGVWSLADAVSGVRHHVSDLDVLDNHIYDIGGDPVGSDVSAGAGVWLYSLLGAAPGDGALVSGNLIADIHPGYDFSGGDAEPGVGVALIDDGDALPDTGGLVTGNQYTDVYSGAVLFALNTSLDEAGPDFSAVTLLALNVGNLASVNETNLAPYAKSDKPAGYPSSTAYFAHIKDAVDLSDAGALVSVSPGTFVEGPQIHVTKNVAISGAGQASTFVHPSADTGSTGDARGWFLVDDGIDFDLSNLTLDGTGRKILQALRHKGSGEISGVTFTEIKYEPSGPAYAGIALAAFGTGPVNVSGSTFTQIGRVGVLYWTAGSYTGNIYTGKGAGNWLDYAIDANAGAQVTVADSAVSGNLGVASVDGSESAGYLVTTYNGAGTQASFAGNTIEDNKFGIAVGYDALDASLVSADHNCFAGNDVAIDTTAPSVAAELNFWGAASGPRHPALNPTGLGDDVSDNVDFVPWLNACGGIGTGFWNQTDNIYYGTMQQAVDAASSGDVLMPVADGPFGLEGSALVGTAGIVIDLNGKTFGPGSPAFTINADDVTIQGPGLIDGDPADSGTNSAFPGILVSAGADNFALREVELTGWADGVELAGDVVSFKLFGNWMHGNTDAGLQVDAGVTLRGVVTIAGNLFKENDGKGVQNDGLGYLPIGSPSPLPLPAAYNSWGHLAGPLSGDEVSANVEYTPWTFLEPFLDMAPEAEAVQVDVTETVPFEVALKVDSAKLYGLAFKFSYDPTMLALNSTTFVGEWFGKCTALAGMPLGTVGYHCNLVLPQAEFDADGGTIARFSFTPGGSGLVGDGPWSTALDISVLGADTSGGAVGGVKVFVDNAGFGAPSTAARDITDPDDGRVDIDGTAQFSGFVDLEGRTNDAGAVLYVYDAADKTSAVEQASGTSAAGGGYTTANLPSHTLEIGTNYYLYVDRWLFLPSTHVALASYSHSHLLADRPLTFLNLLVLLGGDATDDNAIDVLDAGCIGGDYSLAPAACAGGLGWSDVTGDGVVDISDLTLMGGNYLLNYSPWSP